MSPPPLGMSIAQRCARMAEQIAGSAFYGVSAITQETRRAQSVAEATAAEARSVRGEVENKVAKLTHHAEASISQAANVLFSQVQQVVAQTSTEMSRIAEKVTQQLESEINATASSTAVAAEVNTRAAVEGMRRDVQSQLDQIYEDSRHREEEMRRQMDEVATGLEILTKQLNDFIFSPIFSRPTSKSCRSPVLSAAFCCAVSTD